MQTNSSPPSGLQERDSRADSRPSSLSAGIAQDIISPLNRLVATIDRLRATATTEQREILTALDAHASTLAHRVNDLADLIRMESGTCELEALDFDPHGALEAALVPLAVDAERRGASLQATFAPRMPAQLRGDPGRLKQAVHDLVHFALEAGATGKVEIAVDAEEPAAPAREAAPAASETLPATGDAVLSVRVRSSIAGEYPGWLRPATPADAAPHGPAAWLDAPLELLVARRIAHLMHGGIEWIAEPPGGPCLCLTMRMSLSSARLPAAPPVFPGVLRGLKALLVDPQAASRQMLKDFLEGWGMVVDEAGSTAAALGKLSLAASSGEAFRLVLLDDGMSGPTGFDLAQQIKESEELTDATVVLLTANGMRGDAARCRQVGVSAYLTKPIRASRLLEALALALGSKLAPDATLITRHSLREARQGECEWPIAEADHYESAGDGTAEPLAGEDPRDLRGAA